MPRLSEVASAVITLMLGRTESHDTIICIRISSKYSKKLLSNDPLSLNHCNVLLFYKGNIIQ